MEKNSGQEIIECSVDSGTISISDIQVYPDSRYVKQQYFIYNRYGLITDVEPGEYLIQIKCNNSWKKINKETKLLIKSGTFVVGDPCRGFEFDDEWSDFIRKYNNLKKSDEKIKNCLTGGDGCFRTTVQWKKIQ